MKLKEIGLISVLTLCIAALTGCSNSPGEEDVHALLFKHNGLEKIEDLAELKIVEIEEFEEKTEEEYYVQTRFDIVLNQGIESYKAKLQEEGREMPFGVQYRYGDFVEGYTEKMRVAMTMKKTDDGWVVEQRDWEEKYVAPSE